MLLIPAIDLKDGRCVRLRQGDMSRETVFSEDPVAMAQHWVDLGASRLHVVDLNGARSGRPINEPTVRKIIRAVGDRVAIQLGGGLRDLDMIERYIDDGVAFVVIGTAAVKNPGFLQDACSAFGGHVIVALDARGGKVATDGWSKLTGHDVIDLAHKFQDYGVDSILYTDIGRDGMLTGVNIEATVELARSVKIPVIASGGIGGLEDIERLCAVEGDGIEAAILGRALYEGQLDFKAALVRAAELAAAEAGADGAGAAAG
jgi:phosphoribosylformimino-5-aminoimidazole carboxamide ribotide isomerase